MSVRKEDLHQLVDFVNDRDAKLVYDLIRIVIERDIIVEADNSPFTDREKKILKRADSDIENDDLVDWDDLHNDI
jgi:hypothetical protein